MSILPSESSRNDEEAGKKLIERLGCVKCPKCPCYFANSQDLKQHLTHGVCAEPKP